MFFFFDLFTSLLLFLVHSLFDLDPFFLLHCISFDIRVDFLSWVLDVGRVGSLFLSFFVFLFSLGLYGVGFGFGGCKKTRTKGGESKRRM